MEFINPNSLQIKRGYLEPSLLEAEVGQHYQFQRVGYFNEESDSTSAALVFNKTVGLRDGWAKQKTDQSQPAIKQNSDKQSQKSPVSLLTQFGKKYPNLPDDKRAKVREDLIALAPKISYEDLEPLFGTAAKKVGTRIATIIVLSEQLKNGAVKNKAIQEFIDKALNDKNQLLAQEALAIS